MASLRTYLNQRLLAAVWLIVAILAVPPSFASLLPDTRDAASWAALDQQYRRIEVNGRPVSELLGSVLDYRFDLPPEQLQRSLVYMGANHQLRHVLHDVMMGRQDTLRVGVVGGSVSWGHGASRRGETDWFSVLVGYLKQAFPKVNVTGLNGCQPGTPSAYMTMCLEQHSDEQADIMFVEYVLNDGFDDRILNNGITKIYERLMRRLLSKPKFPAVALMQWISHGLLLNKTAGGWRPFHHTPEDAYGAVAQYYDLNWLSFRNAVYRIGASTEDHQGFQDFLSGDGIHPNDYGHKVMADLAVWMIQQTALQLALFPANAADDRYVAARQLPEPMVPDNHHSRHQVCVHEYQLKEHVVRNQGFDWVNEGNSMKPKWGYIGTTPGSYLTLRFNSIVSSPSLDEGVVAFLAHLKSYEHMGTAHVSCESGCVCDPTVIDAHITVQESTTHLARIEVTQHQACDMRVTLLNQTSSGEHNFKVSGIMVAEMAGMGQAIVESNLIWRNWDGSMRDVVG